MVLANVAVGVWMLIFVPDADTKIHILAFLVPLDVGFIGICISLDSRKMSKKRHKDINRYELPHIIRTLEALFSDMAQTMMTVEKIVKADPQRSREALEYANKRARWHMETIRLLTLQFLDSGLSEHKEELDHALVELAKVSFPENTDSAYKAVVRLENVTDTVVQVTQGIRNATKL